LNTISRKRASEIGLFLGPLLFVIVIFIPVGELGQQQLSFEGRIVLAATLWMGTWWITEAIPIYVTSLLPLVIFPSLNITELGQTSANYADRVVFLFLGGFILAKAIEKSNLHNRFALNILKIFGTDPKYIVAAFMVVTGFLSAWMSNTATTMLMLPIATAVVSIFHNKNDQQRFAVCLMLSVAYSASLGGMATLIGTPPNAILVSLSKSIIDTDISFGQWLLVGLPISGISLAVAWLYMINFGAKITHIKSIIEEKDLILKKLSDLGSINRDEKLVAGVFIATAVAWITRGLLWKYALPMVDDSTIVVIAATLLFLIPSIFPNGNNNNTRVVNKRDAKDSKKNNNFNMKLLDWNTAVKIPWGVLLLIGGGLALANAFTTTGVDKWIAQQLNFLGGMHYLIIILAIVSITIFSSEIISNTATAALMIPISASLAMTLNINPILLMVPITLATSYGFIMPVGTPPNAIVFASGHVTAAKMAKAGLPLDIIGIIIVSALSSILVPLL
jgi:sodium-dependent dicarboxylate transporter 2/3/5